MNTIAVPPTTTLAGGYGRTGASTGAASTISPARMAQIDKTAKDYEAGFVGAMLESMFAGVKTNKMFGGGSGEDMYRSLMTQEYGKAVAERGTLGIADSIKGAMIRMQEVH
jgi:Rod binding domain-containing protein